MGSPRPRGLGSKVYSHPVAKPAIRVGAPGFSLGGATGRSALDRMGMNSEIDNAQIVVNFGLIGTLLGAVVRFITHSNAAVPVGAMGGLLVAFLLAVVRGEQS